MNFKPRRPARPNQNNVRRDVSGANRAREISAGIIVYRKTEEGLRFLLLYHGHSYWNFAKGKIESEEKSLAAAIRETREETGLMEKDLRLERSFRAHERFSFKRGNAPVYKIVIFYLAETREERVTLSSEHSGYAWLSFAEAKRILGKYKDSQRVLRQAYGFLKTEEQPDNTPSKNPPEAESAPKATPSNDRFRGQSIRRNQTHTTRPSDNL